MEWLQVDGGGRGFLNIEGRGGRRSLLLCCCLFDLSL
ncbi:hypothetical protein A2U01_0024381, partial [Trifolium medium]|nr:hypothetical protein [Trifolium medium]